MNPGLKTWDFGRLHPAFEKIRSSVEDLRDRPSLLEEDDLKSV